MDKRKIFGTIIGIIFWSFCVIFFTYAYYDWRSDPTNIVLGIEDLSLECLVGADVEVSNIGPVLNYQDGVKTEFSINNAMADNMIIELYLDITSISDNLLTDSLKYVLVADSTGGTNYDYSNPLLEGDFSNFIVGNNLVIQDLEVTAEVTTNYQFIIYIDGNMYNDPNMQENSLAGNLLIGKCSGDSVPYDELVYQAIYSETDNSLTFVHTTPLTVGDTYNDKTITAVYTGFDTATYTEQNSPPWYKDGNYQNITTVTFDSVIKPKSTAYWFWNFSNIVDLDLSKLDMTNATNMRYMFIGCKNLNDLDLSNFDTSKVVYMERLFYNCNNLVNLNISNFNTINVTNMNNMFYNCNNLTEIDLSNFNTSKVINMESMFNGCSSLISLDLSNFDTSSVTNMNTMFGNCKNLISLNVSNFNTSKVTNMYRMFYFCSSLSKLDLSNFEAIVVTSTADMFSGCNKLTKLDISNFKTSNKLTNVTAMFSGCSSLIKLDLNGWDTSKVTGMGHMFSGCSGLTSLDLSSFDTSNVTNMSSMFQNCSSLISLDLSNFNTSKVTNMYTMFRECSNLTNLNISNFDTSKVTNISYIFWGNSKLVTILTIKNSNINYTSAFSHAATAKDSEGNYIGHIIINYIPDDPTTEDVNESTESLVDAMKATGNGNIEKGCFGNNCPIVA